jgi:hypothetical protein
MFFVLGDLWLLWVGKFIQYVNGASELQLIVNIQAANAPKELMISRVREGWHHFGVDDITFAESAKKPRAQGRCLPFDRSCS